jgi:hypothetical protein
MTFISMYSRMPDQQKKDFTKEDYINTLRFVASRWNVQFNTYLSAVSANGVIGIPSVDSNTGFVYRYVENVGYLFGSQRPTDFGFFVKDYNGNETRVPMYRGRDVNKFMNYINGKVVKMIKPLPRSLNVVAYSESIQARKKTMLNMIKWRAEAADEIEHIKQLTGYGFEPMEGIDYTNDFEVKNRLESFQDAMEIAYEQIARDILYRNRFETKLTRGADDIAISGVGMIEIEHKNGKVVLNNIDLRQAIFDNTKDDPLHNEDDYAGKVWELTINEILQRWDWTQEETEDLKSMAANPQAWGAMNTLVGLNGLYWWQTNNGVPKITCVSSQWRSMKYINGEWVETLREGILIGNKYLKDEKESEGQVWDIKDKSKKLLRFRVCSPLIRLGAIEGVVGMIKRLQDLKDAFLTKVIALASSAIGKSYFINANKLPEGLKTPDILSQLKQANIVVLEGADIDDMPDAKSQRLIEPVDMTIDPSIGSLLEIAKYFDDTIADILNIPSAARGQQTAYQSKDVYGSNLVQSEYGMQWYYNTIMLWIEDIVSYASNLAKIVLPETQKGKEYLSMIVGDSAVDLLSMNVVKKMQFEDFLLRFVSDDLISEQEKRDLLGFAIQAAGSGQISMLDYIKLRRLDNAKAMENYFELAERKRQEREQAMQEQQLAMQQQNQLIQAQAQQNMAETQANAKLEDRAMQNDMKIAEMANQQPPA